MARQPPSSAAKFSIMVSKVARKSATALSDRPRTLMSLTETEAMDRWIRGFARNLATHKLAVKHPGP